MLDSGVLIMYFAVSIGTFRTCVRIHREKAFLKEEINRSLNIEKNKMMEHNKFKNNNKNIDIVKLFLIIETLDS